MVNVGPLHETDLRLFFWRTGRSLGRTIYAQLGTAPSKGDAFIGIMDTPELAAIVVNDHNKLVTLDDC